MNGRLPEPEANGKSFFRIPANHFKPPKTGQDEGAE